MTDAMFGPYRLVTPLGRGAMGEVWRAVDTGDGDRVVALKLLGGWLNGDPGYVGRFQRESALAARLASPHIVPIHRYGEIDGRLYIDMPLVDGCDLDSVIASDGPLPPERTVRIVEQIAAALDVAHAADVQHRDVKPSNILVTESDFAYLMDFGLARAADSTTITASQAALGTPAYMAPERFEGEGDHRADVYALTCVLHEALTGHQPFEATTFVSSMKGHCFTAPPRPSTLRGDLPAGLDDVVARGMAKEPADRFDSAGAMAAAARAALVDAPHPEAERPATAPQPPAPAPAADPLMPPVAEAVVVVEQMPSPPPAPTPRPDPVGERTLRGHTAGVLTLTAAAIDGTPILVTGSADRTARIWDLRTGASIRAPLTGHTDNVRAAAATHLDGATVIVTGGIDRTVRIWDLRTGQPIGPPVTGHTRPVYALSTTSVAGRPTLVTGTHDVARIWDLAQRHELGPPLTGHSGPVKVVTGDFAGRPIVVTGGDRAVRIWDLLDRTELGAVVDEPVQSLALTQVDGLPVVLTGGFRTAYLWDLAAGRRWGPLTGHTHDVTALAAAELDGRPVVISGSVDATVRIWDLATGNALGRPLVGHTDTVYAITTTLVEGRLMIASGSADGTVRLWDLAARAHP